MGNGPRKAKHCGLKHTLVLRPSPEEAVRCDWENLHETVELLQNVETAGCTLGVDSVECSDRIWLRY